MGTKSSNSLFRDCRACSTPTFLRDQMAWKDDSAGSAGTVFIDSDGAGVASTTFFDHAYSDTHYLQNVSGIPQCRSVPVLPARTLTLKSVLSFEHNFVHAKVCVVANSFAHCSTTIESTKSNAEAPHFCKYRWPCGHT